MRKILLALVTCLGLLVFGATGADAAPRATLPPDLPGVTSFTLDAHDGLGSAAREAALEWDAGTVVDLAKASCSGYHCIHITVDDTSCGSAGCAEGQADGSCLVKVTTAAVKYGKAVQASVVKHEVGHCMGLGHIDDPSCVMYFMVNVGNPAHVTQVDRDALNVRWAPAA